MTRTCVVTGGSSGIGAELVARLRARGDEVVAPTHAELDLSSPESISAWDGPARIDSLVHCAGVVELAAVADTTAEAWHRTLAANLVGPALLTRALLPRLRQSRGSVVFVNSTSGLSTSPEWSSYSASKFGLRALADALRAEEPAIRVTSIFPSRTATRMQEQVHEMEGKEYDASRWIQPGTVADQILQVIDLPDDATIPELVIRPRA